MDASTAARRQQRGTKRTCKSCEQRFYDLGRDPTICPMCQTSSPLASFIPPPEPQRGGYFGSWSRGAASRNRPLELVAPAAPDPEQQLDEVQGEEEEAVADDVILEPEEEGESDVSDLLTPDGDADPDA